MNKTRKILLIVSASLASALISYFAMGVIGASIASNKIFQRRYSDISTLEYDFYRFQYVRSDYESLTKREEITFSCNGETLMGYFYESTSPKGVIIFAHGVNNLADGNNAQLYDYYLQRDYDIFAIDMTGCGRSSGKGLKSLHESRYCVVNAVKTMQNYEKTKDLPIFLFGHSWGAYGVVAATEDIKGVSAVASFAAYNSPYEMMYGFMKGRSTDAVALTKPAFQLAVSTLWGDPSYFTAETAIQHNSDVPYFVVQGDKDDTVLIDRYSLYDNVIRDNYDNVTAIRLHDMYHGSPWKTIEAVEYVKQCEKEIAEVRRQHKGDDKEEAVEQYFLTVDKEKASELNTDLLNQIDNLFTSQI